jgi:HEPN domain-containing protein
MSAPTEVAQVLLTRAANDEHAARSLLAVPGIFDDTIGLHAQQAVEKSLKAVLAFNGIKFPYTHDLAGLIDLCEENGIHVPPELASVNDLTRFATQWRYDAPAPRGLDRDEAVDWAADAVDWARGILEAQVKP